MGLQSRREKQDDQRRLFGNRKIRYYLGDVRDNSAVINASRNVDKLFRAAALKQVPSCEFYPGEPIRTNVLGTDDLLEAAIVNGVDLMQLPSALGDRFDEPVVVSTHPHAQPDREAQPTLPAQCAASLFPALKIRESHERPEGFEEASVMLTGSNCERLLHKQPRDDRRLAGLVGDYAVPNVSDKVLRLISRYTDYVRRTVWHQD